MMGWSNTPEGQFQSPHFTAQQAVIGTVSTGQEKAMALLLQELINVQKEYGLEWKGKIS